MLHVHLTYTVESCENVSHLRSFLFLQAPGLSPEWAWRWPWNFRTTRSARFQSELSQTCEVSVVYCTFEDKTDCTVSLFEYQNGLNICKCFERNGILSHFIVVNHAGNIRAENRRGNLEAICLNQELNFVIFVGNLINHVRFDSQNQFFLPKFLLVCSLYH